SDAPKPSYEPCVAHVVQWRTPRPSPPERTTKNRTMAKQLVIVESPTKAKTLERYLGPDYSVTASKGHVRDLPEDRMGVELDDEFQPEYEVRPDQKEMVGRLRKSFKTAAGLWLATDFDREGEATARPVAEAIGADPRAANRVTFTEIT